MPVEIVKGVLSRVIDDLEPCLIRNDYDAATLTRRRRAAATGHTIHCQMIEQENTEP